MPPFEYRGRIPASKSLMNRALLVQSFAPALSIEGSSNCDDVVHMREAIANFQSGTELHCGEAGTVLRFMALRVSREPGTFVLRGTPRLLARPQSELTEILNGLGVRCKIGRDQIEIAGSGWQKPNGPLRVSRLRSTQFASGLLLSAWNLPFPLELQFESAGLSEGYWRMSLELARECGLSCREQGSTLVIEPGQNPRASKLELEPDVSSLFAVVAAALVAGRIEITGVSEQSLQPDIQFFEFLRRMRASFDLKEGRLRLSGPQPLSPLTASLADCPDLFPVLASLCAFADGESRLGGAPQLQHKESDRWQKTRELLGLAGIPTDERAGELIIQGRGSAYRPPVFHFDPDEDHRMAMAAGLFRLREPGIRIQNPLVVKKSFPEFWDVVGL